MGNLKIELMKHKCQEPFGYAVFEDSGNTIDALAAIKMIVEATEGKATDDLDAITRKLSAKEGFRYYKEDPEDTQVFGATAYISFEDRETNVSDTLRFYEYDEYDNIFTEPYSELPNLSEEGVLVLANFSFDELLRITMFLYPGEYLYDLGVVSITC